MHVIQINTVNIFNTNHIAKLVSSCYYIYGSVNSWQSYRSSLRAGHSQVIGQVQIITQVTGQSSNGKGTNHLLRAQGMSKCLIQIILEIISWEIQKCNVKKCLCVGGVDFNFHNNIFNFGLKNIIK